MKAVWTRIFVVDSHVSNIPDYPRHERLRPFLYLPPVLSPSLFHLFLPGGKTWKIAGLRQIRHNRKINHCLKAKQRLPPPRPPPPQRRPHRRAELRPKAVSDAAIGPTWPRPRRTAWDARNDDPIDAHACVEGVDASARSSTAPGTPSTAPPTRRSLAAPSAAATSSRVRQGIPEERRVNDYIHRHFEDLDHSTWDYQRRE